MPRGYLVGEGKLRITLVITAEAGSDDVDVQIDKRADNPQPEQTDTDALRACLQQIHDYTQGNTSVFASHIRTLACQALRIDSECL